MVGSILDHHQTFKLARCFKTLVLDSYNLQRLNAFRRGELVPCEARAHGVGLVRLICCGGLQNSMECAFKDSGNISIDSIRVS